MRATALVLSCLLYVGHGRRLQSVQGPDRASALAQLLLASNPAAAYVQLPGMSPHLAGVRARRAAQPEIAMFFGPKEEPAPAPAPAPEPEKKGFNLFDALNPFDGQENEDEDMPPPMTMESVFQAMSMGAGAPTLGKLEKVNMDKPEAEGGAMFQFRIDTTKNFKEYEKQLENQDSQQSVRYAKEGEGRSLTGMLANWLSGGENSEFTEK
mmetsp:Transcript_157005/g.277152  ORF Transcript_157005/g.277152 Transcript_157005/m.277152 type:complete len:210 (+) Transcript_157005:86-715(+)